MAERPSYEELENRIRELELANARQEALARGLAESEKKYRKIFETIPGMVFRFSRLRDGTFSVSYISRRVFWYTGLLPSAILADPSLIKTAVPPEDLAAVREAVAHSAGTMTPFSIEHRLTDPGGGVKWFQSEAAPEAGENGDILWNGISIDISRRKQAEDALQQSENRYRTVSELTSDFAYSFKVNANQSLVNEWVTGAIKPLTGYTGQELAALGGWSVLVHPDDMAVPMEQLQALLSGQSSSVEYRMITKDGSTRWMRDGAVPVRDGRDGPVIRIKGAVQDITDIRKAEQDYKEMETEKEAYVRQLNQVQKMEAIGTLAGGIAHDFNNLLMGIQGQASLMMLELTPGSRFLKPLSAITNYIKSATNLTRQMLDLVRGGNRLDIKPVNLNETVETSTDMFGRTRKEIRIRTRCCHPPPVVRADRRQMEQVLLNLFVNAWQAMPRGGDLKVTTYVAPMDQALCSAHGLAAGDYAVISVTDAGIGMDEATRRQIFDPFFTTKEKGKGTGLGLTSAYGIVKNHAGIITVDSQPGRGSCFKIHLPLSQKPVQAPEPDSGGLMEGSETILLVDDESMILEVGQILLEKLNYRVLTAGSGEQALDILSRSLDTVDLVILDLVMPGMDGGETFDRIRDLVPDMPVILASGYDVEGDAEEIMRRGCNRFIQKPFDLQQLSAEIRGLLDSVTTP